MSVSLLTTVANDLMSRPSKYNRAAPSGTPRSEDTLKYTRYWCHRPSQTAAAPGTTFGGVPPSPCSSKGMPKVQPLPPVPVFRLKRDPPWVRPRMNLYSAPDLQPQVRGAIVWKFAENRAYTSTHTSRTARGRSMLRPIV